MEEDSLSLRTIPPATDSDPDDPSSPKATKLVPITTLHSTTHEAVTEISISGHSPGSNPPLSWKARIITALKDTVTRFTARPNPKSLIAFRPLPVTVLSLIIYISIFAGLIWIDRQPPNVASQNEMDQWGVDINEAYKDLQVLTRTMHPYNSKENDVVGKYLLDRLQQILSDNGVEGFADSRSSNGYNGTVELINDGAGLTQGSNVTFYRPADGITVYFEGMNIMVYIHGDKSASELSPVLVNAHYDSVSTGFGATDDGIAIVSILQVVKSFTRSEVNGGKRLERGLIVLFNNGEEDGLNGAHAFGVHDIGQLPHMFLNLEGAGTGGRATLFRSNDSAVTKFYQKAKRPFGSALSGDGFKMGLIRSNTDYSFFHDTLNMRGLDVAFFKSRSRYHSPDDDVRHTSKKSIWHMLGGTLYTLRAMVDDTSDKFDDQSGGAGKGKAGVWFDFFGRTFAVYEVKTLFAWSVTLVIITPIILAGGICFVGRAHLPKTTIGVYRFPVAFALASAAAMVAALLIHRVNPMIIYSSSDSVWATILTTWWVVAWVVLKGADKMRPTALARGYVFLEVFVLWLIIMIGVAYSSSPGVDFASGYWVPVFYMGVFLGSCISVYELFELRRKDKLLVHSQGSISGDVSANLDGVYEESSSRVAETAPLSQSSCPTCNKHVHPKFGESMDDSVYGHEENWSKYLPNWTWIPQLLLAVPLQLMFVVPIALILTTALEQTGCDGGNTTMPYLFIALFTILILLPIAPFLHRVTYHVTLILLLVLLCTGIYNLAAFPFSTDAKIKLYFKQTVDLRTGSNLVHLVGLPDFTKDIVSTYIPSAADSLSCAPETEMTRYKKFVRCSWAGPSPTIDTTVTNGTASWVSHNITKLEDGKALISLSGQNTRACKLFFDNKNITGVNVRNGAGVQSLEGYANTPNQQVIGSQAIGEPIPETGSNELRLWSREWGRGWEVELTWGAETTSTTVSDEHDLGHIELRSTKREIYKTNESKGSLEGRVVCLWSDANNDERIPAFAQLRKYLPIWVNLNKLGDGLVEAWEPFVIE